jgi:hypothetical protein
MTADLPTTPESAAFCASEPLAGPCRSRKSPAQKIEIRLQIQFDFVIRFLG